MADIIREGKIEEKPNPVGTYLLANDRAYYFTIITKEGVNAVTQTTDHYCENGTVIQDHVIDMPITYTLTGFIAEKYHIYEKEPSAEESLKRVYIQDFIRNFQTLGQLTPVLSSYIYSAINVGTFVANRATALIKSAQSLFGTTIVTDTVRKFYEKMPNSFTGIWGLKGASEENEYESEFARATQAVSYRTKATVCKSYAQERWFADFEKARLSHTLFELHSPYGIAKNMIIESISMGQSNSWTVSDITIKIKQVRFLGSGEYSFKQSPTVLTPNQEMQKALPKRLGILQTVVKEAKNKLSRNRVVDAEGVVTIV